MGTIFRLTTGTCERLEELIVHMKERGAWFETLGEIADATERAV
jgi:hypothetical protein